MADNTEILYVSSDNLITVEGVKNAILDTYIEDATVKLMVCGEDEVMNIDAEAATDAGGGTVGIPITGHGVAVGKYVRIDGTEHYNEEYVAEAATTADLLVITATYEAETFTGEEKLYPSVSGTASVALSFVSSSNGDYRGVYPYTAKLIAEKEYFAIIAIVSGSNKVLIISTWKAHHKT